MTKDEILLSVISDFMKDKCSKTLERELWATFMKETDRRLNKQYEEEEKEVCETCGTHPDSVLFSEVKDYFSELTEMLFAAKSPKMDNSHKLDIDRAQKLVRLIYQYIKDSQ